MGVLSDVNMIAAGVKEKEAGDVGRFLNRILGLSVEKQNLVRFKHSNKQVNSYCISRTRTEIKLRHSWRAICSL